MDEGHAVSSGYFHSEALSTAGDWDESQRMCPLFLSELRSEPLIGVVGTSAGTLGECGVDDGDGG
jgi:hypothetical protein